MILRSITKHVREQNWVAVGIDFLIVVVGVFIGIQVANWNEARLERDRATEYMTRIQADLQDDSRSLGQRIEYWSATVAQGRIALAHAEGTGPADAPAWPTLRAYLQAAEVWRFALNATTYNEMRSAGDLRLIDDPELRTVLASYYVTNVVRRAEGLYRLLPAYRETVRGAVPSSLMRYYWKACHDDDRTSQQILPCTSPMPDEQAQDILSALSDVPGLLPQLRFWIDSLSININLARQDRDGAIALAEQIREASL